MVSGTNPSTYLDKTYNPGTRWGFAFSSIESYASSKYLHLPDGRAYRINLTDAAGDSNLDDYPLRDIRLERDYGDYSNASGTSAYVLIYKDGRREYFLQTGELLAIRDRFMNTIDFTYCTFYGKTMLKTKYPN